MTIEEKLEAIEQRCKEQNSCYGCPWQQVYGENHCFLTVRKEVTALDRKLTDMLTEYEF